MSEYTDPVVYWPACAALELPEFELDVPVRTTGRIEIYKVPVCDAYPEGYFVALNTNTNWYTNVEPGCAAWEKVLLARLLISDPVAADEDEHSSGGRTNTVEYIHPDLAKSFDYIRFNPNDPKNEGKISAYVASDDPAGGTAEASADAATGTGEEDITAEEIK